MGMTGSDKKWPGYEKFCSQNYGLLSILKGNMTRFWKKKSNWQRSESVPGSNKYSRET